MALTKPVGLVGDMPDMSAYLAYLAPRARATAATVPVVPSQSMAHHRPGLCQGWGFARGAAPGSAKGEGGCGGWASFACPAVGLFSNLSGGKRGAVVPGSGRAAPRAKHGAKVEGRRTAPAPCPLGAEGAASAKMRYNGPHSTSSLAKWHVAPLNVADASAQHPPPDRPLARLGAGAWPACLRAIHHHGRRGRRPGDEGGAGCARPARRHCHQAAHRPY